MNVPSLRRVAYLGVAMFLGLVLIGARLAVLQVGEAQALQARAAAQRVRTVDLPAERGEILDRNREPLALTLEARDIYADPRYVEDPAAAAAVLAPLLAVDRADLERRLADTGTSFTYVAREVDLRLAAKVRKLDLAGIGFLPSSRRTYPAGALAPQVLGFVGVDGVGLSGIEYGYDDVLAGVAGRRTLEVTPGGHPILGGVDSGTPAVPGSTVVLTIDRDFQYRVQAALQGAVEANHAKGGMVVVMDPRTGQVLAMASYPLFDPNAFATADQATFRNRPVTDAYEPGSTTKIITAAAAVELGAFDLATRFTVPDHLKVDTYTIHDAHPHAKLDMTLGDIVAQSSNVGIAKVAEELGPTALSRFLERFGLGARTGIGFPGESSGVMLPLDRWSAASLATISYGQGIAASLLQMASAYATIANGGLRVPPTLVAGVIDPGGTYAPRPTGYATRVISEATATKIGRAHV